MKPTTDVMAWLIEFIKRFSLKSPRFFQVFQTIGLIAGLITGIPLFLEQLQGLGINIPLPEVWVRVQSKVIAAAAGVMWLMAKLPVNQPPTDNGQPVPKKEALPFTEKNPAEKPKRKPVKKAP